jgi:hypothetical protein
VTLDHPIFKRWPARYPDRLQLFSLPTLNGVKVGMMLEETGLTYDPHRIDMGFAKWKVLTQGGLPTLPESQPGAFQLQGVELHAHTDARQQNRRSIVVDSESTE